MQYYYASGAGQWRDPPPINNPPDQLRRAAPVTQGSRTAEWEKAERLLFAHLTEEQQREYRDREFFTVAVNGSRYRIGKSWSGNIMKMGRGDAEGIVSERLCVHFRESVPIPDLMLAQKLALETNEAGLRQTANITRVIAEAGHDVHRVEGNQIAA